MKKVRGTISKQAMQFVVIGVVAVFIVFGSCLGIYSISKGMQEDSGGSSDANSVESDAPSDASSSIDDGMLVDPDPNVNPDYDGVLGDPGTVREEDQELVDPRYGIDIDKGYTGEREKGTEDSGMTEDAGEPDKRPSGGDKGNARDKGVSGGDVIGEDGQAAGAATDEVSGGEGSISREQKERLTKAVFAARKRMVGMPFSCGTYRFTTQLRHMHS